MVIKMKNSFLKKILPCILAVIMLATLISPAAYAAEGVNTFTIEGSRYYDEAYAVLALVNAERVSKGLGALTMDVDLMNAAMLRAAETTVFFSHTRPNGQDCFSVSSKAYGENIAAGQVNAAQVFNSWYNSPGHYANMIGSSYKTIGIGCFQLGGRRYWVQLFGISQTPNAIMPSNNLNIQQQISINTNTRTVLLASDNRNQYPSPRSIVIGNTLSMTMLAQEGTSYTPFVASTFSYSSNNSGVASVDSTGKVTAKAVGTAVITATGSGISRSFTVVVGAGHEVRYDANGGSNAPATQYKTPGSPLTLSTHIPTHSNANKVFMGWSISQTVGLASYAAGGTYSQDTAITLYAVWQDCHTMSLDTAYNHGLADALNLVYKFTPAVSGKYFFYSTGQQDTVASLHNAQQTQIGYNDDDVTGSTTMRNFGLLHELTAGQTYFLRVWLYYGSPTGSQHGVEIQVTREHQINFDANGGTGAPEQMTKIGSTSKTLPAKIPTRTGHVFLGWSTSKTATTATYLAGGSYTANASATLYAVWKANTYTVTFKDSDGTVLKTATVNHGAAAAPPSNPSRTGYTFTGWDTTFSNITANKTVTAKYAVNTYTVTFKDSDGTVLKTVTVNHGAAAVPPSNPSRTGYTFTGWDTTFSNITANKTVTAKYVSTSARIAGDVDGSGSVGAADVVILRRYLAGWPGVTINESAADVNGDSIVGAADVIVLRRYLAGWPGVVLI